MLTIPTKTFVSFRLLSLTKVSLIASPQKQCVTALFLSAVLKIQRGRVRIPLSDKLLFFIGDDFEGDLKRQGLDVLIFGEGIVIFTTLQIRAVSASLHRDILFALRVFA